jgi:hypothetical protein
VLIDVAVHVACLEQVVVRAARRDPTPVDDHDFVREGNRRETVRDDQRRSPLHRLTQAESDARLGARVHRRGRVVEDQDARVDRNCAGNC